VIGDPSIFKLIRKAADLARVLPTIVVFINQLSPSEFASTIKKKTKSFFLHFSIFGDFEEFEKTHVNATIGFYLYENCYLVE
jgi:hypothetical protein